jgi:PKD repeat protein
LEFGIRNPYNDPNMKKITLILAIISVLMIKNTWSQDTLVLQPGPEGKDAYINDYYETNYGDYPNMYALATTSWGDFFTSRSLLEFDLSSIPPGSYILEAKLSLYFANNPSTPHYHCGENAAFLQRVIEPWDEHEVTWWNQPGITEQNQVELPTSQYEDQDYPDIDVKDLFQDIISDPENSHGILFRLQVEEYDRKMMFASGDYMENPELRPKLVIIYTSCEPPTADFEYQANGDTVDFTALSPAATSWYWDFGDGYFSELSNPFHIYDLPGEYEVCLVTSNECGSDTDCQMIELCIPVADFTFEVVDLDAFFTDESIFADVYYWDFGDGYFSDLQNPWHAYAETGSYDVCLITWSECGSDTVCETIGVLKTSMPESGINVPVVYPNPASGAVFIESLTEGAITISLTDLNGKVVVFQTMNVTSDETIKIPLDNILPGLYILRFDTGKSQSVRKLLVM